jgi:hypothetical protein
MTFCLLGSIGYANGAVYVGSGQVQYLLAKDRINYTADNALIAGFSAAGSCATNNGLVAVAMRDDEGGGGSFRRSLLQRWLELLFQCR